MNILWSFGRINSQMRIVIPSDQTDDIMVVVSTPIARQKPNVLRNHLTKQIKMSGHDQVKSEGNTFNASSSGILDNRSIGSVKVRSTHGSNSFQVSQTVH